tara:strand:+ start:94 stop:381 length:288 start_codon:yes stop_codon:yes gene_type:complete
MNEEPYYFNNKPLQLSYSNDYTSGEKIEIVLQIQQDYESGMLSVDQMRWIVFNCRFGAFTVQRIIDKLMFDGKLKQNPITLDKRTFSKKPMPFDL